MRNSLIRPVRFTLWLKSFCRPASLLLLPSGQLRSRLGKRRVGGRWRDWRRAGGGAGRGGSEMRGGGSDSGEDEDAETLEVLLEARSA